MNKRYLYIELSMLFGVIPVLLYFFRHEIKVYIIPIIFLASVCSLIFLIRDKNFQIKKIWNYQKVKSEFPGIITRLIIGGSVITILTYMIYPELFLIFPTNDFSLWLIVMILYPSISVLAQEIFFRVFFFHQYKGLFSEGQSLIIINGIAFGLGHLIFGNWIAPTLSLFGGILFARTYLRSESLLTVCIEHALWGDLLFTIGLGYYFYGGAI